MDEKIFDGGGVFAGLAADGVGIGGLAGRETAAYGGFARAGAGNQFVGDLVRALPQGNAGDVGLVCQTA